VIEMIRVAIAIAALAAASAAEAASVNRAPLVQTVPQLQVAPPVQVQPLTPAAPVQRLQLNPQNIAALRGLGTNYARTRNGAALQTGWEAVVTGLRPGGADIDYLVGYMMQLIAGNADDDLRAMLDRMNALLEQKKKLREELQKTRDHEATLARGANAAPLRPSGVIAGAGTLATARDVASYRVRLETTLAGLDRDAQLANVDLQNALQKQQQTLQMMSTISKMLADTAQAVVRKIGG
jgi:hypothetical protein